MNASSPRPQSSRRSARSRPVAVTATAVLAMITLVLALSLAARDAADRVRGTGTAVPRGTVQKYGVPLGNEGAPVLVTLFEDFQCPACRVLDEYLHASIQRYLRQGVLRIEYRPMAFLDDASTTAYSSRALGAAACTLDRAGAHAFARMHDELFANQPPEGTAGLSDDTLADLAASAGVPREGVVTCMLQDRFAHWVRAATDKAMADGITGTPTMLVDGEVAGFSEHEDPVVTFRRMVEAAR